MPIKTSILAIMLFVMANAEAGYISCRNIAINQIHTATEPGYHNFSEVGVAGKTLFISVDASRCTDSVTNGAPPSPLFMVLDDMANADKLQMTWVSMLMTAHAAGKAIAFSARSRGINSRGFHVVTPYYFSLRQ